MSAVDTDEATTDVNDVVAYNVGRIRDRWGWTPEQLDQALRLLDAYPDAGSVPPAEESGHSREQGIEDGKTPH